MGPSPEMGRNSSEFEFFIRIDTPRSRDYFFKENLDLSFCCLFGLSVSSLLPLYFPRFKKRSPVWGLALESSGVIVMNRRG